MNKVRRFVVGTVLLAATAFVFSSCNKDDDTTEKDSGSKNSQGNQNGGENGGNDNQNGGGENGENGGNDNQNDGGENGGGNGVSGNHEYVDLGLPSGTKWATCNVGATKPEAYGDYFAWGETQPKKTYTEDNSRWYGVSYTELQAQGVIDGVRSVKVDYGVGNLTAEYDAATANWGNNWRMPTIDEMIELYSLQNEVGELNGIKGRIFRGTNGNSLFLPFAGRRSWDGLDLAGVSGLYWSATADENDWYAYDLYVGSDGADWYGDDYRYWGRTVRPVLRTK